MDKKIKKVFFNVSSKPVFWSQSWSKNLQQPNCSSKKNVLIDFYIWKLNVLVFEGILWDISAQWCSQSCFHSELLICHELKPCCNQTVTAVTKGGNAKYKCKICLIKLTKRVAIHKHSFGVQFPTVLPNCDKAILFDQSKFVKFSIVFFVGSNNSFGCIGCICYFSLYWL